MKKLLAVLLLTSTILTGCAKGTIEMLETTTPTEQNTTSESPTTTVQYETTEPITEPPTEPPTTWEESISWATKEEMKETLDKLQVPNAIQEVILGNNTVIDSSDETEKPLTDVIAVDESKVGYINSIRSVDMDQDGTKELIISGMENDNKIIGSYIILKECDNGKVSAHSLRTHRVMIATTGYIEVSTGASTGRIYKLSYEGLDVQEIVLADYDTEKGIYTIDGESSTSEEFQKFMEPHDFDNSNDIRIYYLLN